MPYEQHLAVSVAAVVGDPDAYAGELPVVYMQPSPVVDPTECGSSLRHAYPSMPPFRCGSGSSTRCR
jgi:acyl-coenzyme A synthetase/AMP-(fatty) acid ligase